MHRRGGVGGGVEVVAERRAERGFKTLLDRDGVEHRREQVAGRRDEQLFERPASVSSRWAAARPPARPAGARLALAACASAAARLGGAPVGEPERLGGGRLLGAQALDRRVGAPALQRREVALDPARSASKRSRARFPRGGSAPARRGGR
jgi:hypothetical protein